ncbi:hypothetical protein ZOSMA_8726G00010, partial [Zostera marina]
ILKREFDYYSNKVQQRVVDSTYVKRHYETLLLNRVPGSELGKMRVLPHYHKLSHEYQKRMYAGTLAMCRKFGNPTFFITATFNPQWPEYLEACKQVGANPDTAYDIMMRIFDLKLKMLMADLTGSNAGGMGIVGKCIGYSISRESQKRGNPHAHMVIWVEDVEITTDFVDSFVSARIPDPKKDPKLYKLVTSHMLHTCTSTSVCRDTSKAGNPCKKRYPMGEFLSTQFGKGYVNYKRIYRPAREGETREPTFTFNRGSGEIRDDRHVVPYNPLLLLKWNGHINVEVVATTSSPAYVIKYVLKGGSTLFMQVIDESLETNEDGSKTLKNTKSVTVRKDKEKGTKVVDVDMVQSYFGMNYISCQEAFGHIFSMLPFRLSHTPIWINVHLPKDIKQVISDYDLADEILRKIISREEIYPYSRLTAYFHYCDQHPEETRDLTYIQLN